uniref:AmpG permease n=1 Tax=uncultured Thiotrichaceae bacterium TaxID=298394 RepID=A0A6S6U9F6_9GAMM|nr:MAG: AmpG permease [uncultured Thiotrichaceae bacterium]
MSEAIAKRGWGETFRSFLHPRVITMLFLGFAAGVPILLIFSSLSLWLGEAGVKKSAVTFFSWAALGYSFKFVWAPLVDKLPLPILTRWLGRRRSWLLVSQIAIIGAILWMASTDPALSEGSLSMMAFAAVLLGFSSATQDVVIDAYRIESANKDLQALMSSTYIAGYRIGMIVAGAGALYLAQYFGSQTDVYNYTAWMTTYAIMAAVMLIGIATTFLIPEPAEYRPDEFSYTSGDYARFLLLFVLAVIGFIAVFFLSSKSAVSLMDFSPLYDGVKSSKESLTELFANKNLASFLIETVRLGIALLVAWLIAKTLMATQVVNASMVQEAYLNPIRDFFHRYGKTAAIILLLLVGFYRVSDIVLGAIANVFYQELGYTKVDIANVSKLFGLLMTIAGSFLGGLLAVRFGVIRILFLGAVLSAITNLLFIWLAQSGVDMDKLYVVIGADNFSAGLAQVAFIAFLSSLTNISFTAVQYAIFSSLMTLFPKILGGYSGTLVESMGYSNFFIMTTLLTLPVLILIIISGKYVKDEVIIKT